MKKLELEKLSNQYYVRKMEDADVQIIYDFCKGNTQYYQYCGKDISVEVIENDIHITPPGIPSAQKYYMGFFDGETLVAILDLIDGYPKEDDAFIRFFMMNGSMQGKNVGTKIIDGILNYLQSMGYTMCQLGIDKDNPQSNHFWKKNGFQIVREVEQEEGTILVAEKKIGPVGGK